MRCQSNNATPPAPAFAPGVERIDPVQVARELGCGGVETRIDPRVRALVPGFDAPFFQAGLAGYSDAAMRIIARRHGCPFCVTESLLDLILLQSGHGFDKADLRALRDNIPGGDEDHPLAGQVIGSDPDEMAAAAVKMVEQARRPAFEYRKLSQHGLEAAPEHRREITVHTNTFATIDVNLACPVKKIRAKARGGHWLAEPVGAIDILKAVREAVPREIPCTVKLRRSFDETPTNARNFDRIFNAAYELGYAWATVHARTVEQKYIGPSRWPALRDLTQRYADRVIFGSGDIWEAADIFRMIAYTGVHAVSVARGCIGNPWIFRQARMMLAGETPAPPTIAEQRAVLEEHFRICAALHGEELAALMMRKFGIRFSQHHPRAEEVRVRMIAVGSLGDWLKVLEELYHEGVTADLPIPQPA